MADVDVVVVGAGPAGLVAAATLGRHGVTTLLVERRNELSDLPRATVVGTRSMELFRSWGLEPEVLVGGADAEMQLWESPTLAEVATGRAHEVGYPTRAQAAVVSPTAPAVVPQDWVESVLHRHLRDLTTVRVALGTEVTSFTSTSAGVELDVRDRTGAVRCLRSRYLVGADGAHGHTRPGLGIGTDLLGQAYDGVQVVFRAPLWPLLEAHRYGLYVVTTPVAPGLFIPAGVGDRFIYGPGGALGTDPTAVAEAIRAGAGVDGLDVRIDRIGSFHSPAEIAHRFRAGNVFLVGDAAHRVTPRGGTGMNIAIHGGYDLAWKLAWVVRGWAGPALLDSYEAERRAVAEHDMARSADPDGSRRRAGDELAVDLGGRLRHVWLPGTDAKRSTLDLLGPGWTLFTAEAVRTASSHAPLTVANVDPLTARRIGIGRHGGLLARPDGVPVALWSSVPRADDIGRAQRRFSGDSIELAAAG